MKSVAVLFAASAAIANAQLISFNQTTGKFVCAKPNVAYCAGDSLGTDIIVRCDASGVGQPGRCTDNLAGYPPLGVQPALCYQTSESAGDAACEKNCVVYAQPSFTLPASVCTPTYTASSSTKASSSTTVSQPTSKTTSTGVTSTHPSPSTLSTVTGTGGPIPTGNGTCHTCGGGSQTTSTKTPIGPTTTPTKVPTAAASANHVGGALAIVFFAAAYFL